MYIGSFTFIGIQYTLGDVLHHDLTTFIDTVDLLDGTITPAGTPMKSTFVGVLSSSNINEVALRVSSGNYNTSDSSFYDKVITSTVAAAFIAWDGLTILTGTYIFNIIVLFGVPQLFVAGFVIVYLFFIIRSAIALIRGV